MCGIGGVLNFAPAEPVKREVLERMCAVLQHRGPDGQGIHVGKQGSVGLAHRRLSIIDIEGGAQPMSNSQGDLWIVFNGEIYNYRILRKELENSGVSFRTKSDTEVILATYERDGLKGIQRLNGIFAFALYDERHRRLVLARDHFGVKPLYYFRDHKRIVFGSEIKAVFCAPGLDRQVDELALREYLVLRYNPSPLTLFKGIRKLEPGNALVVDEDGRSQQWSFGDSAPQINWKIREDEAIEEYRKLLRQAVERQMTSDVPVGLLLSGGIDSAMIGHLMQEVAGYRVKSFTVGFPGRGDYNELGDARATAGFLNTDHRELMVSREDYQRVFFESFVHTEEPIAEPTIPALSHVTHLASQDVKVVLAGQGADEPLGGYRKYLGEALLIRLGQLASLLPFGLLPRIFPRDEGMIRLARAVQCRDPFARLLSVNTIFTPQQLGAVLKPHGNASGLGEEFSRLRHVFDQSAPLRDSLSRLLYVDTRTYLSDDLLIFGDKMSMAHSLEMRVPYLDPPLVAFLESLPATLKVRGTTGKYLHKKAARAWLPQAIIDRKKRGFLTPMDDWLRLELGDFCKRLVLEKDSFSRDYFHVEPIQQMIVEHKTRKANYYRHIFAVMCLELWYRTVFHGDATPHDLVGSIH